MERKKELLDLVVVGNFSLDRLRVPSLPLKERIGGTAYYTSFAASSLGLKVGLVSNIAPPYDRVVRESIKGVDFSGLRLTKNMTILELCYTEKWRRELRVICRGEKITLPQIPQKFFRARVFHLGPIFNEVDLELVLNIRHRFKGLITLDIQGLLRREENGKVTLKVTDEVKEVAGYADIVKMGLTEALAISPNPSEAVEKVYRYGANACILTMAEKGAILLYDGRKVKVPTVSIRVKDPTGAGDVFMAGLIAWLLRGYDLAKACVYGCVFASIFISRRSFPSRSEVEAVARELATRC